MIQEFLGVMAPIGTKLGAQDRYYAYKLADAKKKKTTPPTRAASDAEWEKVYGSGKKPIVTTSYGVPPKVADNLTYQPPVVIKTEVDRAKEFLAAIIKQGWDSNPGSTAYYLKVLKDAGVAVPKVPTALSAPPPPNPPPEAETTGTEAAATNPEAATTEDTSFPVPAPAPAANNFPILPVAIAAGVLVLVLLLKK